MQSSQPFALGFESGFIPCRSLFMAENLTSRNSGPARRKL